MPRIPFDSLSLSAVVDEMQAFRGGRLQHISQPNEHDIVLTLYKTGHGEARWLWSCATQWARTHIVSRRPPSLPNAPAFCMTLRKYLEGGTIVSIEQRGFDRILDVRVKGHEGQIYTLTAELMGRHSNIILISPDATILQAAKMISARLSRVREVLPGRPYASPPAPIQLDPREVTAEQFTRLWSTSPPDDVAVWLRNKFQGIGPFLASEVVARGESEGVQDALAWWRVFNAVFGAARTHAWKPIVVRDDRGDLTGAYPLSLQSVAVEAQEARTGINAAFDEFFAAAIPRAGLEERRRTMEGVLKKALGARDFSLDQVRHGVAEGSRAPQYRHWGELLLAHLHLVEPNRSEVLLPDWNAGEEDVPPVRVPLDPDLAPHANATRLFERAKHVEANAARLQKMERTLAGETAALRRLLAQTHEAMDVETLDKVQIEAAAGGWLDRNNSQRSSDAKGAPPSGKGKAQVRDDFTGQRVKVLTSPEGHTVLLGENATANDFLVQRAASPNDWWMHVRAGTGSHVVIRTNNAPLRIGPATLQFAARLAAANSAAKHSGMVAVDYTLRKYVRKPRGAAPGLVTYSHEKTINVSLKD